MKKFAFAAIVAFTFAAPAFAGSMTIEFAPEAGDHVTVVLDTTAKTATVNGETNAYSWDEAGKTLCGGEGEKQVCVTFDEVVHVIGATSGYTRNDGQKGTATLTAMVE